MKNFISDKQAEKALDVSKEILDKDGNPYMWYSTDKNLRQLPFEKIDARKGVDREDLVGKKNNTVADAIPEILWLTNNKRMSDSYGNYRSKLADVKKWDKE